MLGFGGWLRCIPVAVVAAAMHSVAAANEWVTVYVEDFTSADGFTQTDPNVWIGGGKANWTIQRSGGAQYVYRTIPFLSGDVRVTVSGQVDSWTANARCLVGIGSGAGSGVAVTFGYFGAGCPTNGPLVDASGATMSYTESPACNYVGPWLWTTQGLTYTATLTVSSGAVALQVPGVGSATGTLTYGGDYNTLFVGNTGDGDWPQAAGTVDMVIIETRLPTDPPLASPAVRAADAATSLRIFPNPFGLATRVEYALPQSGPVRLDVYDVAGRRVRSIVEGLQDSGMHVAEWDGTDAARRRVAAGTYFYSLRLSERELATGRATLVR